jgi:hypothetical protein
VTTGAGVWVPSAGCRRFGTRPVVDGVDDDDGGRRADDDRGGAAALVSTVNVVVVVLVVGGGSWDVGADVVVVLVVVAVVAVTGTAVPSTTFPPSGSRVCAARCLRRARAARAAGVSRLPAAPDMDGCTPTEGNDKRGMEWLWMPQWDECRYTAGYHCRHGQVGPNNRGFKNPCPA